MTGRARGFASKHLLWGLCLAVLAAQALVTARNDLSLLRQTRLAYRMWPPPFYPFVPVQVDSDREAPSLGVDFSQVYLAASALRSHDDPYAPEHAEFRDRFDRRPNYPPLTNHLYVPLSFLGYADALAVHTLASLSIFLGLTLLVLSKVGLGKHALGVCAAVLLLLFETPIGFSHLERGQFDLFVASSFLLVAAAAYLESGALAFAALAALFGALKWTSLPVLLAFALGGLLTASSRRRRLAYAIVPGLLLVSTLAFAPEMPRYWPSLATYELAAPATGMTLEHWLPGWLAKAVPLACAVGFAGLSWLRSRSMPDRERAYQAVALPFALCVALQSQCMFRIAYEYRSVALLGFLPVAVLWMERTTVVPRGLRMLVGALLGGFLIVAFRTFDFVGRGLTSEQMLAVFAVTSLLFLSLAIAVLWAVTSPACTANLNAPSIRSI